MLFFLLMFSSFLALAEIQSPCDTEAMKAEIGATGSCKTLVLPSTMGKTQGGCTGVLLKALNCRLSYFIQEQNSAALFQCKDSKDNMILNQNMMIEASSVKVTILVTTAKGEDKVITDKRNLINIMGEVIDLSFTQISGGAPAQNPILYYSLKSGAVQLTDVNCY